MLTSRPFPDLCQRGPWGGNSGSGSGGGYVVLQTCALIMASEYNRAERFNSVKIVRNVF